MQINNIIFDLGGIIVDIHQNAVLEAFGQLYDVDQSVILEYSKSEAFMNSLSSYERGHINFDKFHRHVNETLDSESEASHFLEAWLKMIGSIPEERLETLRALKENGLSIYLFSNTSPEHITHLKSLYEDFEHHFDACYYSYEIGHRKPDRSGFLYILNENRLKPEETLFVDDMPENIQTARDLAINCLHLEQNRGINKTLFADMIAQDE